ncbi:hypothetical protein SK128_026143 [Halocaridina rubra]|uniref:Uncharacterized protein n=1 Tax=Halocaridina rubra TaxID=373956 RepID=A0AAN9A6D7_HALRR
MGQKSKHLKNSKVNALLTFKSDSSRRKSSSKLTPVPPNDAAEGKAKSPLTTFDASNVTSLLPPSEIKDFNDTKSFNVVVPESAKGNPRENSTHQQRQQKKPSPQQRPQQNLAYSILTVLTDVNSEKENKEYEDKKARNRSERQKVRLDALQEEMEKLKIREEQLERKLRKITSKKYELVSTIDAIHCKIEDLDRRHKVIIKQL